MFFDSHVHTAASPDSQMCPKEAIAAAKNAGLGVAFTEHADYATHENINPNATDAPRGIGDFICDFAVYPRTYEYLRGEGVTLGLEFGLTAAFANLNEKIAGEYDYDFIVGAIHAVDGVDIYHACNGNPALANEDFAQQINGCDEEVCAAVRRYLVYANEMAVQNTFFDSFAHVDYIARYLPSVQKKFYYENFAEEFDALLKTISSRGVALEINTNMFGASSENLPEKTMQKICTRFFELGGRFCTIGSDAHKIKNVGKGINAAKEIAAVSGLVPVYFKGRKPTRCG
jgi:histidinol-phosphatase (PHP family)